MTIVVPLIAGLAAVLAGTMLGWDTGLVEVLVAPPALVRAALVSGSLLGGAWCLVQAVRRLETRELAGMIRGVRLVFLAAAAFAAAGGWLLGSPVPLIVALVIAGVDVVETTFLLLVAGIHRGS
jgi:hypothetical protein